jgi:hypothetical protein
LKKVVDTIRSRAILGYKLMMEQSMIYVAYNHNGREICRNADLGNLMEEVMFYEEVTGNKCSIEQING